MVGLGFQNQNGSVVVAGPRGDGVSGPLNCLPITYYLALWRGYCGTWMMISPPWVNRSRIRVMEVYYGRNKRYPDLT